MQSGTKGAGQSVPERLARTCQPFAFLGMDLAARGDAHQVWKVPLGKND